MPGLHGSLGEMIDRVNASLRAMDSTKRYGCLIALPDGTDAVSYTITVYAEGSVLARSVYGPASLNAAKLYLEELGKEIGRYVEVFRGERA